MDGNTSELRFDHLFDPSSPHSAEDGLFGIPATAQESQVWIMPVPWDVTTSYKPGAAKGPEHILQASPQLDLFLPGEPENWRRGFYLMPTDPEISRLNTELRPFAQFHIESTESGHSNQSKEALERVNLASTQVNQSVYKSAKAALAAGKIFAILGGDHSSPFGAIKAIAERHPSNLGILHIDAHFDLRNSYMGFQHSHASIMHNVLTQIPEVQQIVQVAIRDFSREEFEFADRHSKVSYWLDEKIHQSLFQGDSFIEIVDQIIDPLPDNVYVSFDIDGLDPSLCPDTGTPVPGGISFQQAKVLIQRLRSSGRKIVGFDLCEVAPSSVIDNDWNGNVGARLLYLLCHEASF